MCVCVRNLVFQKTSAYEVMNTQWVTQIDS